MRRALFSWVTLCAFAAQSPQEFAAQGQRAMSIGAFDDAVAAYTELSKRMPANPGWKLNLGIALHMAGRDAQALAPLEAAAKAMPSNFPARALLGTSLMRLGELRRAVPILQQAVALQPRDPQGHRLLADAHLRLGQPKQAAAHLETLSKLEPADPGVWYTLGRAHEQSAATVFEELKTLDPESGPFLRVLADVRRKQQRLRAAAALEEQARNRPAQPKAAALAKQIDAHNTAARRAFAQLAALPANPQMHRIAAETLRAQNKHAEAASEWRAALRFTPADRDVERELAASLYAAGQYLEAMNTLDRLLVHEPENAALHFLKGDCLLLQGDPASATPLLTEAIRLDPKLLEARASLGRAFLASGRGADAVAHLELAAPALDTDGSIHFQLSRAYQAAGKPEKAAEAARRSAALRAEAQN